MINRRRWIKAGFWGSLALTGAGLAGTLARRTRFDAERAPDPQGLPSAWNDEARRLFEALAPVIIGPACATPDHRARAAQGVHAAISALSPSAQREVGELLSLLNLSLTRGLAAGLWVDWHEATPVQIEAFLQRWRHSRLQLLQSGYHALHDLVLGSWYADPQSWAAIGYPGPPTLNAAA